MKRITTFEGRAVGNVVRPGLSDEYRTTTILGENVELEFDRRNPAVKIRAGCRYRVSVDLLDGVEMNRPLALKVANGEWLADEELDEAIRFYSEMERGLRLLGERHHLSWNDVRLTLAKLEGFKTARVGLAEGIALSRSRRAPE